MTAVGLLGILLSLLAFPFAFVERTRLRVVVFMLLCAAHIAAAVYYYIWVQSNDADTRLYFFDPYRFYEQAVRPGTFFVIHLVQTLRGTIGGTYLDYFLIFQAFGFWGVVFLMRTFEEIHLELDLPQSRWSYLVLFLPGIHFWTSMIGKDGPLFMAAALAIWAVMRMRTRLLVFGGALLVMVAFRPYVALVACVALAVAAAFGRNTKFYVRGILLVLALGSLPFVGGSIQSSFGVDVTNTESLGEFFATTSQLGTKVGGETAVVDASYPVRMLSFLFRPFYFDSNGTMGLVASVENTFILFGMIFILAHFGLTRRMSRQVFFLRFAAAYGILLTLLLSYVYYNVGLGLRQKVMVMPSFLTFFVAIMAMRLSELREKKRELFLARAAALGREAPAP